MKNIVSQPITIASLTEEAQLKKNLFNSYVSNRLQNFTFDSFLAIVHRFKANIHITTPLSHQFWEPLCKQIMKEPTSKPHLIQTVCGTGITGYKLVITGRLHNVSSCSPSKYAFMKHEETSSPAPDNSSMGEIVTHNGDNRRH